MLKPKPLRWLALPLLVLLLMPTSARAATLVVFGTTSNDASATGTFTLVGNTLNLDLTNTSAYDGRITGLGFDLVGGDFSGNSSGLNGFTGTSSSAGFTFSDGSLGNVPMFNAAVLDFGYTTGNSGNFNGGSPNVGIDQAQTVNFNIVGPFGGLTEADIAAALFVRFQRVGENGQGSDVGRAGDNPEINPLAVPEPASMLLFGTGLAVLARRKLRKQQSV
jgi:hypothetical protein